MSEINEGTVVIAGTGQAGTLIQNDPDNVWVLLRNGDIWYGPAHQIREPQSQEELDAAPLEFDRFASR